MAIAQDHPHRRSAHIALTALGSLGLVALFLPFSWGTTPLEALLDGDLWRLAFPAFLAPFILLASIRWLGTGRLSPPERFACHLLAGAGLAVLLLDYLAVRGLPPRLTEWISLIAPLLVLGFGAWIYLRGRTAGRGTPFGPILTLQTVYIANALLVLAGFFPEWEVGAYGVLAATMAYAVQIDLVRKTMEGAPVDVG